MTMLEKPNKQALKQALELSLQQSQLSVRQNRLLALAAVFQAAQLTYLLAVQGKSALNGLSGDAYNRLLNASYEVHPQALNSLAALDFYHSINDLHIGLRSLEGAFTQPFQQNKSRLPHPTPYGETFRYATALLHIERKVYAKAGFVEKITQHQHGLKNRLAFFDQNQQHPAILASIANLYIDTAGSLKSRLNVRGKPEYLKDQANVDRIRACLFAGIQAAHLWRQLGGNRWQLIFGRRAMLEDIQYLAKFHYQQHEKNYRIHQ